MRRWYFILLILFAKCTFAQDISFRASAPEIVELGQQFRLIYTINAQAKNFAAPAIDGFSVLAGPSTSQSSNVSIINGKVTQNFEMRYTYVVQANREGKFTIRPAEVVVDGKTYASNPVNIEVIKGSPKQSTTTSITKEPQKASQQQQVSDSDLYIRVFVTKSRVHREEHLVATIKLFSKLGVTRLENLKLPSFQGFITEELEVPPLTRLNQERVNNEVYSTGVLKKYLLYPQKTGDIKIEPCELDVYYEKPGNRRSRSMFDDFFGTRDVAGRKVFSNSVVIHVDDLPENKPFNFSGAVGKMNLNATIDKRDVKTNDAITLRIKISGNGNLKYISPLDINFPADFEVYDPKVSDNINYTEGGAIGNKTFEYLIIPRHAGTFTISEFSFNYFNTETNRYEMQKAGPFTIHVEKSEGDTAVAVSSAFTKEDLKFLGQDIRFIKKGDIQLKKSNHFIFGSTAFWLAYAGSILLFIVIFIFRRKKIRENENVLLVKNKKANKFARKRLKNASSFMKQNQREAFYEELVKALWGYISDKLGIPVANLTKDSARAEMIERNVEMEYVDKILDIIDRCEYARYAPATEETKMDTLYNDAIKVISKLQQKLK